MTEVRNRPSDESAPRIAVITARQGTTDHQIPIPSTQSCAPTAVIGGRARR
jgi:hypothetical protein